MAGTGGEGGTGGMAGTGGAGGEGGTGGIAGAGGMGGEGGMGGAAGAGGMGGEGGMGGTGGTGGSACVPDGGAQWAGDPVNRICGEVTCGAMEVCVNQACTPSALVFLSSTTSDAALDGPRGADGICADLAAEAGLGGYWMSWTSDRCTSPYKRFEKSTLPYRMIDGSQVSASWERMTMDPPPSGEGYLDKSIELDEFGTVRPPPGLNDCSSTNPRVGCFAWTNTTFDGRVHINNGCLGLTTNDGTEGGSVAVPATGRTTSIGTGWSAGSFISCIFDTLHLYCFEQSEADPDPGLPL
jgi:hypothetical protein